MPIRLIDPNAEIKIVIQGTTFVTKPLDTGQIITLTRANERLINDGGTENFEAVIAIIAPIVLSVDVTRDMPKDFDIAGVLRRMYLTDFMDLIVKIINASTVSEDESKN